MESAVGKNEKLESLKLETFCLSWKERSELREFLLKLESVAPIGKFQYQLNFPTSIDFSNFNISSPTSLILFKLNQNFLVTFQLQSLSNFSPNFRTSVRTVQFHDGLSNFSFFFNCPFQLHVCKHVGLRTCFLSNDSMKEL